ncbi:heterokaryon incompatibility protein-domain-containing protein [Lasiosphaeris hirsuta]|uniref:Heterokaryon incompatibility protein-domain-containing protein n=1 Tax=Lasiosphaeris hirsuta TaxID=260670 RepID=A0AA40AI30_9PEZI|nr:heterokaryon incompatibility protein-domain-containing protein [Lasiosphaeris hirsuta]
MNTYQYQPLSEIKRQVRIFTLLPLSLGTALHGHLQIVDFDSPSTPSYETLSYVWGRNPVFDNVLSLDGAAFQISAHLAHILVHLQQPSSERRLWIDAVCIDQTNPVERARQVNMMGDIYRRCTTDLAWLGDPEPVVDARVFEDQSEEEWGAGLKAGFYGFEDWLRELRDKGGDGGEDEDAHERSVGGGGYLSDIYWGSHGTHPAVTAEEAGIRAKLAAVFETRLWSRIWIVQELSCAKEVLLLAGNESLSWETLSNFLARPQDGDAYNSGFPWGRGIIEGGLAKIFFRAAEIDKQRDAVRRGDQNDKSTLLDVLARFCDRQSSDPRDRVYGLLGLVPQRHRRLEADYSVPSAQLFIDVTAEIIRQSQSLDILCQSPWERRGAPQCSRLGRRTEALPSWAVDFAAGELAWNTRRIFSAGGDFSDDSWRLLDGDRVLRLRGYLLGQVGPCQPQPPADIKELEPGIWGREVTEGEYEAAGEPKLRALWRTLVTDCLGYPMQRLSTEDIERCFSIFRKILSGETVGESWLDSGLGYSKYREIERMWERIEQNWAFVIGGEGLFVMARRHVREGDYIAVIEGAKVPLILQLVGREGESDRFEIVSPAYVHGFMDGEALVQGSQGHLPQRELFIV